MDAEVLSLRLSELPRARVASVPTPFHRLPGLSAHLDGLPIWVKREDLTGLAFGGNKARELDFIVGQAVHEGADVLVAGGGVAQSNHARQCAAAARAAGIDVELVLRRGLRANEQQGNLLVTELLGAKIHWVDEDPGIDNRQGLEPVMRQVASELAEEGRKPYVLVSSFHPLAAAGYVDGALELMRQIEEAGIGDRPLSLWVTSMGATHVGLALAASWLALPWKITAVSWRPLEGGLGDALVDLAVRTASLLGLSNPLHSKDFVTLDHGGPAYGVPADDTWEAIAVCLRTDGLLLDPVYTGKGMAALLATARRGDIAMDQPTIFIHTGGLPAMFAYRDEAVRALDVERQT